MLTGYRSSRVDGFVYDCNKYIANTLNLLQFFY